MSAIETYNKAVEFGLIDNPYNWHIWKRAYQQGMYDKEKDKNIQDLKQEVASLISKNALLEERVKVLTLESRLNDNFELERLYDWLRDENREPANTKFTSGKTRNVAREIEFLLKKK